MPKPQRTSGFPPTRSGCSRSASIRESLHGIVVGAEILVIVDGQIVLHQAMEWADRDDLVPMERNSIFRLASMTKPLVGTATVMLAEEGRIGLDEPVAS